MFEQRRRALEQQRLVAKWCKSKSVAIQVSKHGHWWEFLDLRSAAYAEWWPDNGKLAFNGKYKRAVVADDIDSVLALLRSEWNLG